VATYTDSSARQLSDRAARATPMLLRDPKHAAASFGRAQG
jgi:hypothetical protein